MDDPTRRCENDTDNETRPQGLPVPSGSPTLLTLHDYLFSTAAYLLRIYLFRIYFLL
jgi:hypothetical protein